MGQKERVVRIPVITKTKQQINVEVKRSKFECRKDIHFETQPGPVAKNKTFLLGIVCTVIDDRRRHNV